MTIRVEPIRGDFVAEVSGVTLSGDIDGDGLARIREALDAYAVLVFHDQAPTDEAQMAFSRRFGPLETSLRGYKANRRVAHPEISDLSNLDADGNLLDPSDPHALYNRANQLWHTDSSFKPVPAMASLLSGREVPPEGGETEFADLRAAWDALPAERQAFLDGKVAEHSIVYSRGQLGVTFSDEDKARLPSVQQAVVRTHPATGRRNLYLGSHAARILGMPEAEGRALLTELLAFATQPRFVHAHRWRAGDLVMWDNRRVLHRGRPWDEGRHRRVMHRTTIAGAGPTIVDGRHAVEIDVVPETAPRLSA